jgi:hypothetical protein
MENPMITDEQIDALPDDDEQAFVQYEAILREALQTIKDNGSPNWDPERE